MIDELLHIYEESRLNRGQPESLFNPTLIFNEDWLLRAVLQQWKLAPGKTRGPFLPFPLDAKMYSEGQHAVSDTLSPRPGRERPSLCAPASSSEVMTCWSPRWPASCCACGWTRFRSDAANTSLSGSSSRALPATPICRN